MVGYYVVRILIKQTYIILSYFKDYGFVRWVLICAFTFIYVKSSLFYRNIQNAQKETAKDNSVT